jgi:hypothetical protein
MKNAEISKILREANNNTIYLWDLPRPQWKDIDFEILRQIQEGRKLRSKKLTEDDTEIETPISTLCQPNRVLIKRKSDNKVYQSSHQCAYENNLTRSYLMAVLRSDKEHKYKELFELINEST